ncbi:MAG: pentapeptide repeat-containing protein [Deltaproteobacteria bacterium]|nr:pentapeptide repeat-containing protein [Deltaproteobacteria bacterium]
MPSKQKQSPSSAAQTPSRSSSADQQGYQQQRGNADQMAQLPAKQAERSGLGGWFQSAGDWVSERYDQAANAVGEVRDSAAAMIHKAGEVAHEAKELWDSTDLGYDDGDITFSTDLDELADVLPADMAKQLHLDEAGSNEVSGRLDVMAGKITLSLPDLALGGIAFEGWSAGAVRLQGVTLFGDYDGAFPLKGGKLALSSGDALKVSIQVQRVLASQVSGQTDAGPVTVDELELAGFTLSADGKGELPLTDGGGTSAATFSLASAVLRGVHAPGSSADSLKLDQISGGLDEASEKASLSVGQASAAGMAVKGNKVADASLSQVKVDINNQGGGLPMVDKAKDHMRAEVSVGGAQAAGVEGEGFSAGAVSADKASGRWDQDSGDLHMGLSALQAAALEVGDSKVGSASARELSAFHGATGSALGLAHAQLDDAKLMGTKVDHAQLDGVGLSQSGEDWSGKVDAGSAAGVDWGRGGLKSARLSDLSGSGSGKDGSLHLGGVEAHGVHHDGAGAGVVAAKDVSLENSATGVSAHASSLGASKLHAGDATLDQADAFDVSASKDEKGVHIGAKRAELDELHALNLDFAHAQAKGASVDLTGPGQVGFGLDRASVRGAMVGERIEVAQTEVRGVSGALDGDQRWTALEQANLSGISDRVTGASAKAAEVQGFRSDREGDGMKGTVDSASLTGGAFAQGGVDKVALEGASFATGSDRLSGGVKRAQVDHATFGEGSLDQASLQGASFASGKEGMTGGLDRADLSGASYGDASLRQASLQGASFSKEGGTTSGKIAQASATGAKMGGSSVAQLDASGLSGAHSAQGIRGAAHTLDAQGVKVSTPSLSGSASGVSVREVSGNLDKSGAHAQLSSASADQVAFSAKPGQGGPTQGQSGLDMAALTRTASERLDRADLDFSAELNPGKLSGVAAIQEGTRAEGHLGIADNRIQDGTRVQSNKDLDTLPIIGARGAYVEEGKVRADLNWFPDLNVGKELNKATGVQGGELASVAEYGAAAAQKNGSGPMKGSSKPGAVNLDSLAVDGSVGFSNGTLDAGLGQVELAGTKASDNELNIQKDADGLVASMSRFVAGALKLDMPQGQVEAGPAALEQVKAHAEPGKGGAVSGTIGSVTVQDVSADLPRK